MTVLARDAQPLASTLGTRIGGAFAELHRRNGVDLRTEVEVTQVTTARGRATGVQLADGGHVPAEVVVLGVGAVPNIELAAEAGIDVDSGVLVDAGLRTSRPDIVAVGDIAEQRHPGLHQWVRVEHWDTARHQPAVAARTLLGKEATYERLPFFFTDQFDLGMEYRGRAGDPDDVVVRGDVDDAFLAFWLDADDRVRAAMNVNVWDAGDQLERLVADGTRVDRARLADVETPLEGLQ